MALLWATKMDVDSFSHSGTEQHEPLGESKVPCTTRKHKTRAEASSLNHNLTDTSDEEMCLSVAQYRIRLEFSTCCNVATRTAPWSRKVCYIRYGLASSPLNLPHRSSDSELAPLHSCWHFNTYLLTKR